MSKKAGVRHQGTHTFIRFSLASNPGRIQVTAATLLEILESCLTGMYGVIGGAVVHDLVYFEEESSSATIRCRQRDEARIWAATAFMTSYRGCLCHLQVLESSPTLMLPSNLPKELRDIQ